MTQEDKDLLLKDLCSRVPYRVKCKYDDRLIVNTLSVDFFWEKIEGYERYVNCTRKYDIENIKPYLFPLSSMTVEQMCKVQNLLPDNCDISFKNQKITFYDEGNIQLEQLEKVFNFFNMHHIDYRGLIPMGLANDAPEGMYN